MKRPDTDQAIQEGERRSRQACSRPANEPVYLVVWRRGKWWIIGAGLLIIEGIVMSAIGGTGGHF